MRIQFFCTLFVLSVGVQVYANCGQTPYATLLACRECQLEAASRNNIVVNREQIDGQCRSQTSLTASQFCIEQATLNHRADRQLSATDPVPDSVIAPCNTNSNVAGVGGTATNVGSTTLAGLRDSVAADEEQRRRQQQVANAPTTNSGSSRGGGGGLGEIGDALSGVANGIGNWFQNGSPRENNGLTDLPAVPGATDGASGTVGGVVSRSVTAVSRVVDAAPTAVQLADANAAVTAGPDVAIKSGTQAMTDAEGSPGIRDAGLSDDAADARRQSEQAESAPTPRTGISGESDVVKQRIITEIQTKIVALKARFAGIQFTNTVNHINSVEVSLTKYLTDREKCTRSAERAQFLCAEGSSPGAQASRAMINLAGPVLAGISSTQRTCNSTADVAKFVSGLMTVAKGVCIGAKVACDMSCNEVLRRQLPDLKRQLGSDLIAQIESDWTEKNCTVAPTSPVCATAQPVYTAGRTEADQYVAVISVEEGAHTGTVAGLKKHCDDKIIDIALMGANIGSMMAAANSAKRCAEQTAGQNASGDSTVAVGMYCDQASNQQTQFCVCQRNPMAESCPEYLASQQARIDQLNAENDAQAQGLNLRPSSGVSAFAGGSAGAAPGSSSGLAGGLDLGGGSSGSTAGIEGVSNSPSAESGLPVVTGGGSAAGGFGSSAKGSSDAVAKPGTVTDKAPSALKALANSIGGLFGGKGDSSENGGITARAPSAEAVQQRRASERVAAEISPANGKSNWQKVREQYLSSEPSFIFGQ